MSISNAKIISPGPLWQNSLKRLAEKGLYDVYFEASYVALNAQAGEARAFLYEERGHLFFFPFIKRPVLEVRNLYDFETAYGYGGVLSESQEPSFLQSAWQSFFALAREEGYIAGVVRTHPVLETQKFCNKAVLKMTPVTQTVLLDLSRPLVEIEDGFKKDHHRLMRKSSQDQTLQAQEELDAAAWQEFKTLYTQRMQILGAARSYFFDDGYFEGLKTLTTINGEKACRLFTVRKEQKLIAGALVLTGKDIWNYHLSASDEGFFACAPNNILLDHIIRSAHVAKAKTLLLGGGRTPAPDDPLLRFKQTFSQTLAQMYVGGLVINPQKYSSLCRTWENGVPPEKRERYKDYVLKYRY